MFDAKWTEEAAEAHEALSAAAAEALAARRKKRKSKASKAEGLFAQVQKCVELLLANPRHPGLRTHEYHSLAHPLDPKGKVFEAYAQNRTPGAYRVFWCYGPGKKDIAIIAITPHP
jgi:hypothetical protein